MGQKRRSSTIRQVTPPNGSVASPSSILLETARSPISSDLDVSPVDAGKFSNVEGTIFSNGEALATAERPEISKAPEASRVWQEDPLNVKSDCEKALVALRRGNSNKALRLIRDACLRYEGSALVQRIRGHIGMRLASLIEDQTTKQKHLKEAIDAAQKAVQLSPRSVEYAQFHAQLLFEAATDSKGYDEVVQECQRALEIQDPIDPAKESIHDESQQKLQTAEARILQVQQELRNLIQKANIASISNWMKTLGNGGNEEKLRFVHMRKPVDDPLEQRVSQPKRPHEVKKSVKTAEERRKDIEVRVAAARLLQQRRDCSPPASQDGSIKPAKDSGRLERRRSGGGNGRKSSQVHSIEEKIERMKPFWISRSPKEREKLLEIPLNALKQQYTSSKPNPTSEILTEALEFASKMKTWRFWICCSCGEKFTECQEHAEHMTDKHVGNIPSKLRTLFPSEIVQDIVDQIMVEDCRPLDGPKSVKLLIDFYQADMDLENPQRLQNSGVSTDSDGPNDGVSTLIDISFTSLCESEDSDMSIIDRNSAICTSPLISENSNAKGDEQLVANMTKQLTCDRNTSGQKSIVHVGADLKGFDFPYADDEERAKLLQKIFNYLRILISNKCLASDHMEKIMHYSLGELQSFIPASSVHYEFSHSPIYIKFLPAPQLRHVFGYLRELASACDLDQPMETGLAPGAQNEEEDVILDRLILNESLTMLTLDERLIKEVPDTPSVLLTADSERMTEEHTVSSKIDSQIPPILVKDGGIVDLQLSWVYRTADYEHQPAGWKQFREARAHQCRDILRMMEKEFQSLKSLCEKKHEQLQLEVAINMAEALCAEELKKRESKEEGNFSAHETVLRKRKQELLDCRTAGLSPQQNSELDVITSILRDAQSIILHRFPYDGAITMSTARLSDSDEDEEHAWRDPDVVLHDACIHDAIQRKKEQCTSEINKLDARILRSIGAIQKYEQKLGNASILDYRSVVLPFVKSFLKVQIEEAAEQDAFQKSDAAQKAFLAELSRDGKATAEKLSNSTRSLKEKPKEKKKNKEQRRSKDGKRGIIETQQNSPRLVVDNGNLDEDGSNWDLDESQLMEMELKKMTEAEQKWQAEVEDEERKLAEALGLQRRIEDEAKEKHLAELEKKNSEMSITTGNENTISHCTNLSCTRNAPNKANEISPSFSVQKIVNIIEEISSSADVDGYHNYGSNVAENPDDPVSLSYSTNQDSGHARPKKSGKCRRKKLSQTTHDEANQKNTDVKSEKATQFIEQTRSVVNNEMRTSGVAVDRMKSLEPSSTNDMKIGDSSNEGENSVKSAYDSNQTLKQLKAEQDAEERFQEDLKQAMQESLVNVPEQPNMSEMERSVSSDATVDQNRSNISEVGKGLQNEIGQYNCFLNVVIQSLWHLRRFREELLDDLSIHHVHMGEPCVVCALREIFVGLNSPSSDSAKEIVAPTTLRIALSNLFSQKDFFQEAQMNDASEVLAVVFECLHKAFANNWASSDGDSDNGSGVGAWECQDNAPCIAHSLFALDISMQMNCTKCGLESRHLKYSTFFHNINANSLRTAKILYQESSLDELLRLVEMNEFLACDVEVGGCGQQNYIHYLLRAAPHVFITVLGWQNDRESFENISATMDAIAAEMDVGIVYHGLDRGFRHRLVSVICYYGQHYHCFAFNHEIEKWVMFDDTNVKVIGTYKNVVDTCCRGHLQPQVLFYEASSR